MPRAEFISFLVVSQILTGFLFGPAFVFGHYYGYDGYAAHIITAASAVLMYCGWMWGEMRRKVRRHSEGALRSGLFATMVFCIFGTAVLALGPLGLEARAEPLQFPLSSTR